MIYKSYIIEQNIDPVFKHKIFLFYGENEGLKKEFRKKIKINNPKLNILRLYQEDILKNQNILINEILNKSLFEEKKIIFIEQVNDKILNIIEEIIEIIENEKIFIFSNNLDKKSKIRSYFEKSKDVGVTACYPDNEISIRKIIEKGLRNYQGLTPQVVNIILQNTNLDRNKVNNEIEKIQSCFKNKKIDQGKIESILNISENEDFNKLKDEALNGNKTKINRLLADTIFEKDKNVYYLNSINQRINKLDEIENLKIKNKYNTELIISSLKPPVFWKDKPILTLQSSKWNKSKLKKAFAKTYEVEINIKSNSFVRKDLLIKNLIIDLCNVANGP